MQSRSNAVSERPDAPLRAKPRWKGNALWGLLVLTVLFLQWPMLKGLFYRTTGAEAPRQTIAWRSDFDAALAEAKANGKPLLVDFSASWCPPCIVMKHDVWPDPEVSRAVAEGYVPLLVDVDDPRNVDVARRYASGGIPFIVVVDGDGRVLRQASFMSKAKTMEFLTSGA